MKSILFPAFLPLWLFSFASLPKNIASQLGIILQNEIPFVQELNKQGISSREVSLVSDYAQAPLLFKNYPQLTKAISYIHFAELPTPTQELSSLNHHLDNGCKTLYIKRDDLTGSLTNKNKKLYGGNKVRKLEFLLADARARGAQEIITFGAAGSNHACATGLYAHQCGMRCTNLLKPQVNSCVVQQNLLLSHEAQANLLYFPDNNSRKVGAFAHWLQCYQKTGIFPYVIPTGGSCPLGALGFVNAAFELKDQILRNQMPEPDYLYIAHGSCGTVAGLTLGLALAGLKISIVAVATEPHEDPAAYYQELKNLYHETNNFLHERDSSIPVINFPENKVTIRFEYAGENYGMATQEGLEAQQLFKQHAGIFIDNTYTSKAAAALIADARAGLLQDSRVLFWNTFCGLDFSEITDTVSYQDLPACFHDYFK